MKDINNYIDSTGKIKTWPSKHKLKQQVAEYIADKFEFNHFYTEKEVNNLIEQYHTFGDYFLIRRELIERRLLLRTNNGSKYWRKENNISEEKIMISQLITSNYCIGKIIAIIKMKNGVGSVCYHILTDQGEFILKNIEENGMNHAENEYKIHEILKSENIPVSNFYPTKDGQYILEDNGKIYHIQSFIKGEIYKPNTSS